MEALCCPRCESGLVEVSAPSDGIHTCSACKHEFSGPIVASNPLAELHPCVSEDGALVFESNRTWALMSAAKFAKLAKTQTVFIATVEQVVGDLHFTHRAAHGGEVEHRFEGSKELLTELESEFPNVFAEPTFPITANRTPFTIPLVDPAVAPPRCKLYPLSGLELEALKTQVHALLESGRIVPSSSPYGAPILFAEKKGGGGLRMCVDYRSLNANTVMDSWLLPRIDKMLARLKGAWNFSKLDLRDGYH